MRGFVYSEEGLRNLGILFTQGIHHTTKVDRLDRLPARVLEIAKKFFEIFVPLELR